MIAAGVCRNMASVCELTLLLPESLQLLHQILFFLHPDVSLLLQLLSLLQNLNTYRADSQNRSPDLTCVTCRRRTIEAGTFCF